METTVKDKKIDVDDLFLKSFANVHVLQGYMKHLIGCPIDQYTG